MFCFTLALVDLLLFFDSSYRSVLRLYRMACLSLFVTGFFLVIGKAALWTPAIDNGV